METFVEKAQIYAAGFDDRLIEIMKYIIAPTEDEDISFTYDHMVFTGLVLKTISLCLLMIEGQWLQLNLTRSSMNNLRVTLLRN